MERHRISPLVSRPFVCVEKLVPCLSPGLFHPCLDSTPYVTVTIHIKNTVNFPVPRVGLMAAPLIQSKKKMEQHTKANRRKRLVKSYSSFLRHAWLQIAPPVGLHSLKTRERLHEKHHITQARKTKINSVVHLLLCFSHRQGDPP